VAAMFRMVDLLTPNAVAMSVADKL
jgi:hypothetical protein